MTRTLTLEETAQLLKTSVETVSDCVHHRGLPAARIGRAFVLVEDDVITWLREQYGKWRSADGRRSADGDDWVPPPTGRTSSALDKALAPRKRRRKPA